MGPTATEESLFDNSNSNNNKETKVINSLADN
jgi:hypothetical protein